MSDNNYYNNEYSNFEDEGCLDMKNPNLYITADTCGGLWTECATPWDLPYPWTAESPR